MKIKFRTFDTMHIPSYPQGIDLILAQSRWDLWWNCGLWNEDLISRGKGAFRMVWPSPKVSDLVLRTRMLETRTQESSRMEWKRKLKAGAIEFSRNVDALEVLSEDKTLDREGIYEIRCGFRVIFVGVSPPWKVSLEIRLRNCWPWLDNWLYRRELKKQSSVAGTR